MRWEGETPHRSAIAFQLRVANSKQELNQASWLGPQGADSYFTEKKQTLDVVPAGEWIQYKAIFDTDNGAYSPILEAVEIVFE